MKMKLRLLSLTLTLCLLLLSLSSCLSLAYDWSQKKTDNGSQNAGIPSSVIVGDEKESSSADVDLPASLRFTLTEEEADDATSQVNLLLEVVLNSPAESEETDRRLDALEEIYNHLVTQEKLAYLAYCIHGEDETASSNYLFASDAVNSFYEAYIELCQAVDASDCAYKATFFSDWSEEELAEMRGFDGELLECNRQNDRILVEYRAQSGAEYQTKTAELYLQMLNNNQRIAELNGYGDYWTYAYEKIYERDFGATEVKELRENVKTYLVPLYEQVLAVLQSSPATETVLRLLEVDVNNGDCSYIRAYLSTYALEDAEALQSLFDEESSVFPTASDSYHGAYTCYLEDLEHPICYFGTNYQDLYTVVHEMGHYFAMQTQQEDCSPLDLAEIQSQGNEWLFTAAMKQNLPSSVYHALCNYQLLLALRSIILGTLIDEFEEACYQNIPETAEGLDSIMNQIAATYGNGNFLKNQICNPNSYWRLVVLESPVYYVSYAVSMIPALELFCFAEENFNVGQEKYLALIEEVNEESEFLNTLTQIGFSSPFEKSVYQKIIGIMKT